MTVDGLVADARAECDRRGVRGDAAVMLLLAALALEYRRAASVGFHRPFVDWSKVGTAKGPPSL